MIRFYALLVRISAVLLPLSIVATSYLYLYPYAHQCAFPRPPPSTQSWLDECTFEDAALARHYQDKRAAPFRLLALGDPQLEGDTSLPARGTPAFRGFDHVRQALQDRDWHSLLEHAHDGWEDLTREVRRGLQYARKELDLLGNDFYLAHIYRTLRWATKPTHVTVLGDLLGSQWINDEEFEKRAGRFWQRVFRGAQRLPDGTQQTYKDDGSHDSPQNVLGADEAWKSRIINIVGNHDIGYAGDIDKDRVARFERAFGSVNGDMRFVLPTAACNINATSSPALRIVVLNSMNLDVPAQDNDLQEDTYRFINSVIEHSEPVESHDVSTILLTHIPLHKEAGVCVDEPYFSFFEGYDGNGVKEQNMISKDVSTQAILQALYGKSTDIHDAPASGLGRDGIILTGHDHEGCDVYHHVDPELNTWNASTFSSEVAIKARQNQSIPGIREVTVRSMMGEFGGNAGLLSAWWDQGKGKWQIEVETCALGVQHIWWAIHILDILTLVALLLVAITRSLQKASPPQLTMAKREDFKKPHRTQSRAPSAMPPPRTPTKTKTGETAFSRRLRQSLEEDRLAQENGSAHTRSGSSTRKSAKKRPAVKIKQES